MPNSGYSKTGGDAVIFAEYMHPLSRFQRYNTMKNRIAQLQTLMKQQSISAMLVSASFDIQYLTGLVGSALERESLLLVTQETSIHLVDTRKGGAATAADRSREYSNESPLLTTLNTELIQLSISELVCDEQDLSIKEFDALKASCSGCSITTARSLVAQVRVTKDETEITAIMSAVAIADQAFRELCKKITIGQTESEISWELEKLMRERGAQGLSFSTIIAINEGSAIPHYETAEKKVTKGSTMLIDFGCVVDGYCSDITRNISVGAPTDDYQKQYDAVKEAQETALTALAPGIEASVVDKITRDVIKLRGYDTFQHGLGHGVGLEIHESPTLNPNSKDTLEPGMVFSIEPGIYIPAKVGVRIEDLVLMTENGPEILTQTSKELVIL